MRRPGFTLIELIFVAGITAILAAILFPVFTQARAAGVKSRRVSGAYQLGLALQLYGRDHDGKLPPGEQDLSPLVTRDYAPRHLLLNEADPLAEVIRPLAPQFSSFQYRGGLSIEDRADIPLLAEWHEDSQQGAMVLSLSGSVKWVKTQGGSAWIPVTAGPRPLPPGVGLPPGSALTPFRQPPSKGKPDIGDNSPAPSGGVGGTE